MRKIRVRKGKVSKQGLDRTLLATTLVLTVFGLVAVADASAPQALNFFGDELYFFKQQAMWAAIGVAAMLTASFIKYSLWEKLANYLFFANIILLLVVLIPGVGLSLLGARRWIVVGPASFQPSELIKLTLALYIAKVASRQKGPLAYFVPIALVSVLIMLQPDLGTTLIVGFSALSQVFVSGVNMAYLLGAGVVATGLTFLLTITSQYRRQRLEAFLESARNPLGSSSYHIRQVLLALGSGGFLGVGLGRSRQKYLFLPEAATDSILAVLAEEFGFLGTLVLIAIFALFVYRALKIASRAPDKFSQVAAVGLTSWVGAQIFLNIGSMTAILPLTGVPLPFISYGGTALTTMLFATGILLNISRYGRKSS